jgi:syntaxin-binding protein 5
LLSKHRSQSHIDLQLRIRLIAIHASGATRIFTFVPSGTSYTIASEPTLTETLANPIAHSSFVLDAKTGSLCKADRSRLGIALQATATVNTHVLWISASGKGARCVADVTGEKLGKAEWNPKEGTVWSVQVVERNGALELRPFDIQQLNIIIPGALAIVALTDKGSAFIYSLPHLEYLHTLRLPTLSGQYDSSAFIKVPHMLIHII